MHALWVYQLSFADGRVVEADMVQSRSAPYVQVHVDLYTRLHRDTRTSLGPYSSHRAALAGMRAAASDSYGRLICETSLPLKLFEPDDAKLLFQTTREHLAKFRDGAGDRAAHLDPSGEWSEVVADLLSMRTTSFTNRCSEALRDALPVLLQVIEKLTDILIWEARQRRVVQQHPKRRNSRHAYPRSTLTAVAGLEALLHLSKDYVPIPVVSPKPEAPVIDLTTWKRTRVPRTIVG